MTSQIKLKVVNGLIVSIRMDIFLMILTVKNAHQIASNVIMKIIVQSVINIMKKIVWVSAFKFNVIQKIVNFVQILKLAMCAMMVIFLILKIIVHALRCSSNLLLDAKIVAQNA